MNLKAVKWLAIPLVAVICHQSTSFALPVDLENKVKATKYGVVLDAGSSGTRIKVYKYVIDQHSTIAPSDVQQLKVPSPDKRKPGISALADSINEIPNYLKVLIDNAKKVVPADQQAATPIMLFATAGMRLLSKDKQRAILKEVDCIFSDKILCPFLYKKGNARVITGEEEAVFGWITVNFLKGSFSNKDNTHTIGALDLGGASSQNTFRVSHSGTGTPTLTINLAGKTYPLYAHSYLGYGVSEATNSYVASLVHPNTRVLNSPCHNTGYTKIVTIKNNKYELKGKYDKTECRNLIKEKFFCDYNEKQCPMINQPMLEGRFYGISVFYYVMKDVGAITSHGQIVSLCQFKHLTQNLCKQTAKVLNPKLYDVYNLCFRLNYVYELLKDGYHVDLKTFVLQVGKKVNQFDLNWTLGAMLYKSKIL